MCAPDKADKTLGVHYARVLFNQPLDQVARSIGRCAVQIRELPLAKGFPHSRVLDPRQMSFQHAQPGTGIRVFAVEVSHEERMKDWVIATRQDLNSTLQENAPDAVNIRVLRSCNLFDDSLLGVPQPSF